MDPSKLRIPAGVVRVEIDEPGEHCIEKPVGVMRGWFAATDLEISEGFFFKIGGLTLAHRITPRIDVEAAMPGHTIIGFSIPYDVFFYLPYINHNCLVIDLVLPGWEPYRVRFKVKDSALAACLASACDV